MVEHDHERSYSTDSDEASVEESASDQSVDEEEEEEEEDEEISSSEEEEEEESVPPPTVPRHCALEGLEFERKLAEEYEKRRAASEARYHAKLQLYRTDPRFELHEQADPTNIFQLCRPGAPDTISMDDAYDTLNPGLKYTPNPLDPEWDRKFKRWPLECVLCESTVQPGDVIEHFFGNTHYNKVSDRGAAVSYPAMEHWIEKMIRSDCEKEEENVDEKME